VQDLTLTGSAPMSLSDANWAQAIQAVAAVIAFPIIIVQLWLLRRSLLAGTQDQALRSLALMVGTEPHRDLQTFLTARLRKPREIMNVGLEREALSALVR
jgi:hypothetical protein